MHVPFWKQVFGVSQNQRQMQHMQGHPRQRRVQQMGVGRRILGGLENNHQKVKQIQNQEMKNAVEKHWTVADH